MVMILILILNFLISFEKINFVICLTVFYVLMQEFICRNVIFCACARDLI